MKTFPSPRFEVLLSEQGTHLVPTKDLRSEFHRGRVPLYVLSHIKLTEGEKGFVENKYDEYHTLWVTQQIFSHPVRHHLTNKNNKTIFELGKPIAKKVEEVEGEIGVCLRELINVCTATPVRQIELMTMAECLLLVRLMGDLDPYPYSKLCLFDEGTLHLEPMNPRIQEGLDIYIDRKTAKLRPKMIQATQDICHRFLRSIPKQASEGRV